MKRNLLFLPLLFLCTAINAQLPGECAPGTTPPVAPFCSQTCTLCDDGIDGYVGMNVPTSDWEAPPDFCAPQFHAVQWLAFVAGTPSISFDFTPFDCDNGTGLQVAIYGSMDCQEWQLASNCDPDVPEGSTITLDASGLTVGGTYFFVVDGNAGDFCSFEINVTSGSTVAPDVVGTPVIMGPTSLCTGGTASYWVNQIDGAGYYNWTLDGVFISGEQFVDIDFPNEGQYELCVTPGNSCYGDGQQTCITIDVGPLPTEILIENVCFEDMPYSYQGFTFSSPGNYDFSYFRPDGCEQPVNLTLNVVGPIPETTVNADICFGEEAYIFNGNTYTQTGFYTATLQSADGCDSIVNLNLNAQPPAFTQLGFIDHCELLGPYYVGGTAITTAGDFSVELQTYLGCDSIVNGYLNLTTPDIYFLDTIICPGGSVEIGTFIYTEEGSYNETYIEPGGCESSFQVDIDMYDPVTTIDTIICPGESVTIGGVAYSTTGMHTEIVPALFMGLGCDSVINLNLTVIDPIITNLEESICEGESFMVGDSTFTTSGMYTVVLQAANNCDSTVNLDLTVFPDVITTLVEEVCFGDAYMVGDSTFTASGNYTVGLLSAQGCDSTVYLDFTVKAPILTTLNEAVCDGDSFTVGSMAFDSAGTYDVVLTAADGCDSTVTLNLSILEHPMTILDEIICQGESYTVGSSSYSVMGTYMDTLAAANGCDSIITLNLTVQEPIINDIVGKICTGQTYTVGTSVYDQAGSYTDTLANYIGCDSIVNLTLTIEDVIRDTLTTSICEGETYTVAGNTYDMTGFYDHPFVTASGCDSVFSLDLTVIPIRYTTIDSTICDGESVTVGSNTYTTSGNYEEVMMSIETACDSIVTLNLIVLNVPVTDLVESICDGETYEVGTSDYTLTGIYVDTLVAANGCDSIVNLDLTVLDVPETFLTPSICDGEDYEVGTSVYTLTGNYTDILVAANGCDSIVYTDLIVLNVPETFLTESICQFETYEVGSSSYTLTGDYTDTLIAANGCDSIVYLNLTVFPEKSTTLDISICNGSSYPVGDSLYTDQGTYVDTLSSSLTGCDSIVTLNLMVTDFYEINLDIDICEGESYTVGTTPYTSSGMYSQMFISSDGCDSIVNLDLTVIPLPRNTIDSTICDGESVTIGMIDYTDTGTFVDTLTSFISGCDSIVTLNLTVNEVFETFLVEEICDGESFPVGTFVYDTSGIYQNTLTASNGCDSVVNLDLTVHPILMTSLIDTICFGDSYTVGFSTYNSTGIYTDILPSVVTGCDSIIMLDLFVRPEVTTSLTEIICYGDDFTVGASTYNTTGTFVDILTDINGCDSTVTLNLTVRDEIVTNLTEEICDGESFGVGGTSVYTVSGIYADTLTSLATGCDSIVNLDLAVHPIPMTTLTEEICDGESFTVGNSSIYTVSGIFVDTLTSSLTGCDSIVNLNLTVHPIPMTTLTEIVCFGDDFTVGTSTYNATGTFVDTLTSVTTGCDSVVTLNLTVRDEIRTELTEEICDGESFIIGGNSAYTVSGTFVDTLTSIATDCDSIVTLNLTVHPIPMTTLTEEICDGESFTVGSSSYTVSGTFMDVLTSEVTGCDSIVTLNLTVHPIPMTTLTEEICDGESFTVGSNSIYTVSGTFVDTLTSVITGCDSIVTLDLTVHPIPMTTLTEEICDGESFTVGSSSIYTVSGTFVDTLTSVVTGCDSIVTLDLTVHPIPMTTLTEEICDGESFIVGNNSIYTTTGNYVDTLTSVVTACDSIVMLSLTVHPVYDVVLDENICEGDEFPVGTESFSATGTYTVNLSSVNGCDSIVTLNLSVFPCELELTSEPQDASCFGYSDGYFTFELQTGTPPYAFDWESLTTPGMNGTGTIDGNNIDAFVENLPVGTYQIEIVDSSPFAVTTSFTVSVGQPEPIDIEMLLSQYSNFNISCDQEMDGAIDVTTSGGTPPYQYEWNTGSREEDVDELGVGQYFLTVTDANACLDSASALLNAPPPMIASVATVDPLCFGDEQGLILVNEVNGGVGPYLYSLNDAPFIGTPQFGSLGIGNYDLAIQDANGCEMEESLTINQPDELIVVLGEDQEIELGEPVNIYAQTSYDVEQYIWQINPDASPDCIDCEEVTAYPQQSMAFAVTVVDSNNCEATDRITVFVNKKRDVYIPNVFSPNNDGQNDIFYIFAGNEVVKIKSFYIFNRWGEPMFEYFDFPPNDPLYGWDGSHRGELMNGGVYVYMAELEFVDGEVVLYKGDVILMR
ncbi:MAG: gliding motility-associated C-terminal domain-containing protein [Chitinophagales bacterium]|nr:gliding motility-associated C-terminal domain-containing protein [Chitinophagales bacterium]